jgi:hypothetical protein
VILDSGLWERDEAIEALHDSLEAHGVSVVVSLNEYQSSAEMAVDLFDPGLWHPGRNPGDQHSPLVVAVHLA